MPAATLDSCHTPALASWKALGERYIADMSVTTNALGPSQKALDAVIASLRVDTEHYPDAQASDAREALAKFLCIGNKKLILMGNGASELIDLTIRITTGRFRLGPYPAQYSEYERVAHSGNREVIPFDSPLAAGVTVVIRPNSPTGDFMTLPEVRALLDSKEGIFIFDESFLPFMGPNWAEHSAVNLLGQYGSRVMVIHSWTKIWSCPGLRLGSVTTTEENIARMEHIQVPWSCSALAQRFAIASVDDGEYMVKTWAMVRRWKVLILHELECLNEDLHSLGLSVTFQRNENSPLWVPWIFVTTDSEATALLAVEAGEECGVPIRWCRSHGLAASLRLGIRDPDAHETLFRAIKAKFVARMQQAAAHPPAH
ncbi:putative histidinol-phosphate aminotransferase [Paratrimastix pyriformis]|uniref:Histidinol-phosphate aminotransferase n=1 Tax=Paratrimastix pyriformis TaxID=342808 RepID=A0ABQ8UK18_9EUKA|nr:putative histidinol-phosphate aminotransferase [Paratrimastix pyriformis]